MNCTDVGTIQAFLDGELGFERSSELSEHIAACDNCAVMLADAETESALVFPVLSRELDTLVPTQRLWSKINDSIELEKEREPWWKKVGAFASLLVANPSLSAAAAVLVFVVIGGAFWLNRSSDPAVATVKAPTAPTKTAPTVAALPPTIDTPSAVVAKTSQRPQYSVEPAVYRRETAPRPDRKVVTDTTSTVDNSGEESYINTIATLNKSVNGQKDETMRPSERVAYERDMALVNDTIGKMRKEVEKNPKNNGARQVLYTSYQNKIDLLTSVAQKEELTSSIR